MNEKFIFQYEPSIENHDIEKINKYLESGGFITEYLKTRDFENGISNFCNVKETIIFPNGTLTLFSILKVLGIKEGSKVIVPNYTMAATAFSVVEAGAEVIFCDIEWPSLCLSLDNLCEILERESYSVAAIMFMPANGRYPSYDINYLLDICRKHNIFLIEDSAQALGSYYPSGEHMGTVGIAGSLSFSMPKIITTGQGGAVISSNLELIASLRKYRDFGRTSGGGSDNHDSIGLNFKFTDLQAVLGISQLERINKLITIKKENFKLLYELVDNPYLNLLHNDINKTTPWFYEVHTNFQIELSVWLKKNNIGSRVMYPELNKQKAFKFHKQHKDIFPISKKISNQGLWIPSHPKLNKEKIIRISEILNSFKPK